MLDVLGSKKLLLGYILLFIGSSLLLTGHNFPELLSILSILIGHIVIILFGKNKVGLSEILKVDLALGAVLSGYYVVFNGYKIGIAHHFIIGLILWISVLYLKHKNRTE